MFICDMKSEALIFADPMSKVLLIVPLMLLLKISVLHLTLLDDEAEPCHRWALRVQVPNAARHAQGHALA